MSTHDGLPSSAPILQADPSDLLSDEAAVIAPLQEQLSHLWELHGRESDLAQLMTINNRATEVLREVEKQGWDDYHYICEDAAQAARKLWRQCEVLVNAAAEVDGTEEKGLLPRCKQLLAVCDLLITLEEEIVCLMDTGPDNYGFAHRRSELCWQQHFSLLI